MRGDSIDGLQYRKDTSAFVDAVVSALEQRRLIILVGAGISGPPPSSLPLADSLCRSAWESLIARLQTALDHDRLNPRVDYRPEEFFSMLHLALGDSIFPFFDGLTLTSPNHYHEFIASLGSARCLHEVWTTNFDPLIEDACSALKLPREVLSPDDYSVPGQDDKSRFCVVKLHGTVRDGGGEPAHHTLAFTSRHVDRPFPKPFRDYLRKRLSENDLLVLGYSGRDAFDIEPMLRTARGSGKLLWVQHCDPPGGEPSTITDEHKPDEFITRILANHGNGIAIRTQTEQLLLEVGARLGHAWGNAAHKGASSSTFVRHAREWANRLARARVALAVGIIYWSLHANRRVGADPVRRFLEKARQLGESEDDSRVCSHALRLLAMVEEKEGNNTEAEANYREAIDIAQSHALESDLCLALEDYGHFLAHKASDGRMQDARRALEAAQTIADRLSDPGQSASVRAQMGFTYTHDAPRRAIECFETVLRADSHVGWVVRLWVLDHISHCYKQLGQRQRAFTYTLEYISTAVAVYGLEWVLHNSDGVRKWNELVVESVNPRTGADWKDTADKLSEAGLQSMWLLYLTTTVSGMIHEDMGRVSRANGLVETVLAIKQAFRLAIKLATCSYIDWKVEVVRLAAHCVDKDARIVNDVLWDLSGEEIPAQDILAMRQWVALGLFVVKSSSPAIDELYYVLAHTRTGEILGAVAGALENLSLTNPKDALRIAGRLATSECELARETAACALEHLGRHKDPDAIAILRLLADDPVARVARAGKKFLGLA